MRIRHSVTRVFGILVVPAISAAAILYFGYYAIWGTRGLVALADVGHDFRFSRNVLPSRR